MKKTFVMILGFLLLSVMAFAEYQAFNYQGSIKMPVMVMKKVDGKWIKTWQLKTETLKGILVSVCCYPCRG